MKYSRIFPVACLLLLASCVNANAGRSSDTIPAQEGEVTVEFRVENAQGDATRSFTPGDSVQFVFEVKNRSAEAQHLAFTFPPHRVQVASRHGAEPVWQAWEGQMFPQVMRNRTLAANSSETFSVNWKIGVNVVKGTYQAQPAFHGFIDDQPLSPDLAPTTITVE